MLQPPVPITIGLAAYNSATTLAAAIDSLLAQTHAEFRLLVSDNASTDGSAAICAAYAERDSRIRWIQLPATLPIAEHYRLLLNRADTEYFMWAAADDLWAPRFIADNLAALAADHLLVASQSRVLMTQGPWPIRIAAGTAALVGTPERNLARFLANPADNSRFYGVFRRDALQRSFPSDIVHGFDWVISATSLAYGRHHQIDDVLMLRDETSAERYLTAVRLHTQSRVERMVPFWPFTRQILTSKSAPLSPAAYGILAWLNLRLTTRFASLHLFSAARRRAASAPQTFGGRLASRITHMFSPGMRERLGRKRADAQTHGWERPLANPSDSNGCSIIVITLDGLLPLLKLFDHIPSAARGLQHDITVVDLGSTDATRLHLAARPDVRLVKTDISEGRDAVVRTIEALLPDCPCDDIAILSGRGALADGGIARAFDGQRHAGSSTGDKHMHAPVLALRRTTKGSDGDAEIRLAIHILLNDFFLE
jgi:glycosyltransferase involved in cell wall biosynthesis